MYKNKTTTMRGNLFWSYRTQTAKFVEDDNGKFQIVGGQIEPIVKEMILYKERPDNPNVKHVVFSNSSQSNYAESDSNQLRAIRRELREIKSQYYQRRSGNSDLGWASEGW